MAKKGRKVKKSGLGWQGRFVAIAMLVGSLYVMPITVFFMIGMIPTFVAAFVDKDPRRMSAYAIGALNLAATIAYIVILWEEGGTMAHAMQLLSNPTTLMIVYGCCWAGWIIHFFIPPIIAEFVKKSTIGKLKRAELKKKELFQSWGDSITGAN